MTEPPIPRQHEIVRLLLALSETSETQGETLSDVSTNSAQILLLIERLLNPNNERVSMLMDLMDRIGTILEHAAKTHREISQVRTELRDLSIRLTPLLEILDEEESLGA